MAKEITDELIEGLAAKVAPFLFGFKAKGRRLVADNGMELLFSSTWNNKTTISGLGTRGHSIGCSFLKDPKKIAEDIERRLLPEYRSAFRTAKIEQMRRDEDKAERMLLLDALADMADGEVKDHYSNRCPDHKWISSHHCSIEQHYSKGYLMNIEGDYQKMIKIIKFIKNLD